MRIKIEQENIEARFYPYKEFVPWFRNFLKTCFPNDLIGTEHLQHTHWKTAIREHLKPHRASLIETYGGWILDFDDDADATWFVLRWS